MLGRMRIVLSGSGDHEFFVIAYTAKATVRH